MREKIHLRNRNSYIVISVAFFILVFYSAFVSFPVVSQEEQLVIQVTNKYYEETSEIFENEDFYVSVYVLNESNQPTYIVDVEIIFNGVVYQITYEEPEIILKAPQVSKDTNYTLVANKTGYNISERNILIKNKLQLVVTPDKYTIKAGDRFSVRVTDEIGNPVSEATVGIQSYAGENAVDTTNDNGRAWLVAPEERDKILLRAQKNGYIDGTETVWINTVPFFWEKLLQNPYTPIFIAVLFLIFAIVFVNLRQKRLVDIRAKEISKEKNLNQHEATAKTDSSSIGKGIDKTSDQYGLKPSIRVEPNQGTKVEEIRISKSSKEKDIVSVKDGKKPERKTIPRGSAVKHDYDWFEGTDDIRYEIDRITGEIDEEGIDKWFEGIDDIRAKIDDKVKKKDKKRDN